VPVFAFSLANSDIEVDICINNDAPSTVTTVKWLKEYPMLKPLFLLLKHGLSSLAVDNHPTFYMMDTKRNGLASFTLICLIVRFLQVITLIQFILYNA
jgi:DNA polymerase sigma